jgi:HSP20 family protein
MEVKMFWAPFERIDGNRAGFLGEDMSSLFQDIFPGAIRRAGYPAVNVWQNQDKIIMTAELPGYEIENIQISLEQDVLTISGERAEGGPEEQSVCHRKERKRRNFKRSFKLPFRIQESGIEAAFSKGVLKITLPRAEEDKPKKIAIKCQ